MSNKLNTVQSEQKTNYRIQTKHSLLQISNLCKKKSKISNIISKNFQHINITQQQAYLTRN